MNLTPPTLKNALAPACLVLMTLLGVAFGSVRAAEPAPSLQKATLRLLFANSLIQNVNRNDVLAARAAGVPCVALSYGYNHGRPIAEENPAYVLDCLSGLLRPAEPALLPGLAG